MDKQRAITLLCQMYLPHFDVEEKEALTMGIGALEKQVEQEAIKSSVLTVGERIIQTYNCPMCGTYAGFKTIDMNGVLYRYCEYCGQKVRIGELNDRQNNANI